MPENGQYMIGNPGRCHLG